MIDNCDRRLLEITKNMNDSVKLSPIKRRGSVNGSISRLKNGSSDRNGIDFNFEGDDTPLEYRLVDALRLGTNGDYSDCRATYNVLVEMICSAIPEMKTHLKCLNEALAPDKRRAAYCGSPDWSLLRSQFNFFETRQVNDEECNWRLHHDPKTVSERLDALLELLYKVDENLVQYYLQANELRPLSSLIQLYQRELSSIIRQKLLKAIGICCGLDPAFRRFAVSSILPLELIRELQCASYESDFVLLATCLRILTILICQSTELPFQVKDSLTPDLFSRLLSLSDPSQPATDLLDCGFSDSGPLSCPPYGPKQTNGFILGSHNDLISIGSVMTLSTSRSMIFDNVRTQLGYAVASFLLACNWHFCSVTLARKVNAMNSIGSCLKPQRIPLIECLIAQPSTSRQFLELVLQAFNRDIDPPFIVDFKFKRPTKRLHQLKRWSNLTRADADLTSSSQLSLVSIFDSEDHDEYLASQNEDMYYAETVWNPSFSSKQKAGRPRLADGIVPSTPRHSVIKFLCDIYTSPDGSELICRNDQDVILDVLERQIRDFEPESVRLHDFLLLLGLMVNHSNPPSKTSKLVELAQTLKSLIASIAQTDSANAKQSRGLAAAALQHIQKIIS